ncbi:MAG: hypothetical protein HJJLKODD_01491 [Phycisphaerae bacterium]|nr:hypothetical protein [Phycisphaerae bacterium]
MNWSYIHFPAVVVAALSAFVIGGLWYSPLLFARAWMQANHVTDEQMQHFSKARAFGGSLVMTLLMSFNLAMFLADEQTDWLWGLMAGGLAGIGWAAMAIGVVALFENRSWRYILINGGYQAISFMVMGLILGAWR